MEENREPQMPVVGHLSELRKRLILSIVAVLVTTIVSFVFSDSILRLLIMPLPEHDLKAFGLMDGFMIRWRISLLTGVVAASPIWAYEIYGFVRPALRGQEKDAVWPMLLAIFLLFVAGIGFGFFMLSSMISALLTFFPSEIQFMPSADNYISFVVFFLLACGVVFELPPVIIILVRLRILKVSVLRKQRVVGYFILFAFAEIVTPVSDPIVAPLTVMAPLVLLYEVSILWAARIERKRAAADAARPALSESV